MASLWLLGGGGSGEHRKNDDSESSSGTSSSKYSFASRGSRRSGARARGVHQQQLPNPKNGPKNGPGRRRRSRTSKKKKIAVTTGSMNNNNEEATSQTQSSVDKDCSTAQMMEVGGGGGGGDETSSYAGIEVSLSNDKNADKDNVNVNVNVIVNTDAALSSSSFATLTSSRGGESLVSVESGSRHSVISIQDQLIQASKVYRSQFSSTTCTYTGMNGICNDNAYAGNILGRSSPNRSNGQHPQVLLPLHPRQVQSQTPAMFRPGNHRIPLLVPQTDIKSPTSVLFDDIVGFLKSHVVLDEKSCVQEELSRMEDELDALELDRKALGKIKYTATTSSTVATLSLSRDAQALIDGKPRGDWDVYRQLLVISNPAMYKAKHASPPQIHNKESVLMMLSNVQRAKLQTERGTNLTVFWSNGNAKEALLAKCGSKTSVRLGLLTGHHSAAKINNNNKYNKHSGALLKSNVTPVVIAPQNCRDGGAAATMQHFAMWKNNNSSNAGDKIKKGNAIKTTTATRTGSPSTADCSFFMSRDNAKSYCYGSLPERLQNRLQKETQMLSKTGDSHHYSLEQILYLSTGPMGCYYVEFRSGECWWGFSSTDRRYCQDDCWGTTTTSGSSRQSNNNGNVGGFCELETICREWSVYRIAFGPIQVWQHEGVDDKNVRTNSSGGVNRRFSKGCGGLQQKQSSDMSQSSSSSWVVLARDGRVAWKNVPARLHNMLSSRLASESAPIEVSLGNGDAYFIRFLDGTFAFE